MNPSQVVRPNGYSHVVVVVRGKLIIIAGQTGANGKGEISKDFAEQAKQAFDNLRIALAAAGAQPRNVVKLNYYIVGLNRGKLTALRTVRGQFVDVNHLPASTLIGVQSLVSEDAQIEIDAEAVKR